ncbi:sigma-70 family RNA polymerase sigma factor [[Mycobacterium] wendilense]|uniref:Sigma-70 family RNA polymerase sigma factor n=1 Tax=[Mycobacterium] wendilense TaxID=3064284 RepID=A0ABN9NXK5_9MYCO|nr:sigma-70 family RNA polymerase sigma factor [Mycolicibacterium sp. MU0050]CAJ1582108.1 sigma-70 family RNA polymerase sigma factor [Mycolicibacterium sp. MU0050]
MTIADIEDRAGSSATGDLEDAAEFFTGIRHLLFGVAHRMLRSVADAEDVVQDSWVRWQCCDRAAVQNPTGFLLTVTTRLCINELQSAHNRRETQLGPWILEPVDADADPALCSERGDALRSATRIVVQKLPPTERAAYVLREAFDYPYRLISHTVGVSEANARQLVSRARKHLTEDRDAAPRPVAYQGLFTAFVTAAESGEMAELERALVAAG